MDWRFLYTCIKAFAEFDNFSIITVQIFGENDQTYTSTLQANNNEEFSVDIGKHLFLGLNRIEIVASADNSGTSTPRKYTSRYCYEMALRKDESFNPRNINTGILTFPCVPVGSFEKTLEVYVNGALAVTQKLSTAQSDYSIPVNIPKQNHGVYTISAKLIANLSGVPVVTDPIEYQVAWVDPAVNTPLIWTPNGYPSKIVQYEDLRIEYMVWAPELKEIETRFYKRGAELPNSPQYLDYSNNTYQYWNITDYEVGNNSYAIMVGSASLPLNIYVEEDTERDLGILQGGLVLNLDSAGRSNLENISSKTRWVSDDPAGNAIAVKFNNFNWYNNGWIEDENKKTCLRISNGASIEIPVGSLNVLNSAKVNQALAFEFRFKVRNVQEYSTLITTTSEEDENGKLIVTKTASTDRGVIGSLYKTLGFCIGTQEAFLGSSNNTIVNARYREDEIVNLTFVIDNNAASLPLMYIYLQGILSGIAKYGEADQFNSAASSIVFNSDYSIYDAIRAGFGKVVFVIRHAFEKEFREVFSKERFGGKIEVEFVFQELDYLPEGCTVPEGRVKPWGTNHALLMAKEVIHEPFAVINADDFYGAEAYETIGAYLSQLADSTDRYCMVAYNLNLTLSENGTVSRGVCGVDEEQNLTSMVERTKIERMPSGQIVFHDLGEDEPIEEETPVSMNLFGFTPDYFTHTENYFKQWFKENTDHIKGEFYIPTMVNKLIADGTSKLRVLRSAAQWYGVTYKEDKPALVAAIRRMVEEGKYPEKLWE